jgi:hypothetical protein
MGKLKIKHRYKIVYLTTKLYQRYQIKVLRHIMSRFFSNSSQFVFNL